MKITRRQFWDPFFQRACVLGLLIMSACRSRKSQIPGFTSCDDFSQVPESDQKLRISLAYTETSPIEDATCGNCNLWLPPKGNLSCGGCTLFSGPVETNGYCTYWAPLIADQSTESGI